MGKRIIKIINETGRDWDIAPVYRYDMPQYCKSNTCVYKRECYDMENECPKCLGTEWIPRLSPSLLEIKTNNNTTPAARPLAPTQNLVPTPSVLHRGFGREAPC